MPDSDLNRDFIERIDESQRSSIGRLLVETTFVVPTVASFAMGDLDLDETLAGTYSANT